MKHFFCKYVKRIGLKARKYNFSQKSTTNSTLFQIKRCSRFQSQHNTIYLLFSLFGPNFKIHNTKFLFSFFIFYFVLVWFKRINIYIFVWNVRTWVVSLFLFGNFEIQFRFFVPPPPSIFYRKTEATLKSNTKTYLNKKWN